MTPSVRLKGILGMSAFAAILGALAVLTANVAMAATTVTQPRFGSVEVVTPKAPGSAFVILLSDPNDSSSAAREIATEIADRGAAVAVIDAAAMRSILQASDSAKACIDLFGDLESLARMAERQIGMATWQQPVLLGIGDGGAVAYLGLAQAPSNTLAGAVSFGFSPTLASAKPFCDVTSSAGEGAQTFTYQPAQLAGRWIAITANAGEPSLKPFLDAHPGSQAIAAPAGDKAGRDAAIKAVFEVAATTGAALSDLPLVELPAKHPRVLVVFFSGDGGWRDIDKQLGELLSKDGVAVIGVDALRYFWSKKDPQTIAADIHRIIAHYGPAWGVKSFALAGYSFGAGIIPLTWPKLAPATQDQIKLIAMLGLEPVARLQMSMAGWLGLSSSADIPLGAYLAQLPKARVMCVYSVEEQKDNNTGCTLAELDGATRISRTGGHHFGGDYDDIARIILERLNAAGEK
ncbi:Virulence factor family protein [Hyphomicrobium sp. GJ21]|uniref:AcvB/VirJ family lysyl-phosphatidylglycerol hydrolase n=1 Tax=Hyphomicrobium sp. GJ21 TaxID=113574 RepID=UPI000622BE15|nr:AcvB/VirJ family lysyl-phosphatidylglycerol hydrolase [Hyphomicrobium sp. GJ21]CEJ83718.1 Virulence factor family protein [Hyphomicrobium sp. GJ21]